ncbi:short chain dehydrogenase/reductase SDR [Achaetomium macrosporum]|uniref:Short chain dehydrogenase/reductase SDR n=1 Tax=Achaetomium macrosporum TaxID=79813 RepID=A0AAN7H9P0_9PEZI|nr:short chain dehydrogenase/reductase SDR [Achaetomium macrosporum]
MPRTVLITEANGSLGLGFVQSFLASHPDYTLVATVRHTSPEADPNTAKLFRLIAKYNTRRVFVERLDLGHLAAVRAFTDTIIDRVSRGELPSISAVVCNAFAWSLNGQRRTGDGYEATF